MNKIIIPITSHDSPLAIIAKIAALSWEQKSISLDVQYSLILRDYLFLKLLRRRFPDKKISLITTDVSLRRIAEHLEMRCFLKKESIEFEEEFSKHHILRHNFTFTEYFLFEIKKLCSRIGFFFRKRRTVYRPSHIDQHSPLFLIIIGLVTSFTLLGFIFYFAVSKTYIFIVPEVGVKTVSRNINFTSDENILREDHKSVLLKKIDIQTNLEYTFNVTSLDKKSARNAAGKAIIYNELPQDQIFRPNTRFVSDEWLVFRCNDWIRVPAMTVSSGTTIIGKSEISLVADIYDTKNEVIGIRGNIDESVTLTIPWLKFNRDKVYAKPVVSFVWGANPVAHILSPEEYDRFVIILIEKMKSKARENLGVRLVQLGSVENIIYDVLPIDQSITYGSPIISVKWWKKIHDTMEEVTLVGSIDLHALVYNRSSTLSYLKSVLSESLLYGTEKLISVDDSSLRITDTISQTVSPLSLRATTELDARISYNFEDSANELTRNLKTMILNLSEKDAKSALINEKNISNVRLKFSPFWMTRVTSNPDNIDFIIEQ